jgi:cellulose synthase/poly-beta-1,6-N-acetylglucosamine synthase-like glycosyltransferase
LSRSRINGDWFDKDFHLGEVLMSASQILFEACFWACVCLVGYVYFGYPVVVWILSRLFGRPAQPPVPEPNAELPRLSLLIAAHNEEAVIEARIRNALELDYPPEKLEIVIASDGSSDRTNEIVRRYAKREVRLLEYTTRRGKAAVLNRAFTELTGDVIMLSDANTNTSAEAARNLIRWFQDPEVGVVCGRLLLTDAKTGRNVDGLYWRYETFLKKCEGRLGALLGVNGAIYAIRRHLYSPVPEGTIVDDLVIPLRCRLQSGCALIFDPTAVAREETAPDVRSEFHRRSRLGAGGFQCLGSLWPLLNPRHGWIAFTLLSHKIFRWVCPFAMIGLLLANLALLSEAFFRWTLAAQILFYAFAGLASYLPGQSRPVRLGRLATMFVGMNAALFVGFWRWLAGRQKGAWKRTERTAEIGAATAAGPPVLSTSNSSLRYEHIFYSKITEHDELSASDSSDSLPSRLTGAPVSTPLAKL